VLDLRTERLRLRLLRDEHVDAFVAYRNDPRLAEYQAWELPFTRDQAQQIANDQAGRDDVADGHWTTIAVELDGEHIGDVVANVRAGGAIAEVGYTLRAEFHGKGYASEATNALIAHLVERGAHRIEASLDDRNVPSMRVLEAVGMQYECLAKQAFCWRGDWVDDLRYAMTADEWRAWRSRPVGPPEVVELVEIAAGTARPWETLATHWSQRRFVATVTESFADALFPAVEHGAPLQPWIRGIVADGERAGFLMAAAASDHHPEPYLWRLLVDRRHQRRGIGERAVQQFLDLQRADGRRSVLVSYVAGTPGSPEPFYRRLGFVPTGEIDGNETVARLTL
jgi:RimJ/RimL family protein N-acetyltransferase